MGVKVSGWWEQMQKYRRAIGVVVIVLIVVVVIALMIVVVLSNGSGFNGYNKVSTVHTISGPSAGTVTRTEEYQPGKTLWDWLQLLFIPAVLALGAIWYTARQNHDLHITLDNQREVVLQTYLDKMSELLLEKHLRDSQSDDEVRKIAHVRTLAVLSNLDNRRKGNVLQFLHESDLININKPIIYLGGADLGGADLSGTFHKAFPWEVYHDIVDTPWENIAA